MRHAALAISLAAFAWATPAAADTASDIAAIEQRWGDAFLTGDRAFLERLLAPEFRLMRAEGGRAIFTPRAEWFATLGRYTFHAFEVRTLNVADAGDTAVATISGRWKVTIAGRGTRDETFIVSDTFVRRGGAWRAVFRHSTPHPHAAPPPPAQPGHQRGR